MVSIKAAPCCWEVWLPGIVLSFNDAESVICNLERYPDEMVIDST